MMVGGRFIHHSHEQDYQFITLSHSNSLFTDCHEEGGLIRSPAAPVYPHSEVGAGQAHGDALSSRGGAHSPVVKTHVGVIGMPMVNTYKMSKFSTRLLSIIGLLQTDEIRSDYDRSI